MKNAIDFIKTIMFKLVLHCFYTDVQNYIFLIN